MNKKKISILIGGGCAVCAGIVLFVIFGIHRHEWTAATCTEPEICLECGETRGEALGHTWKEATCTLAATCGVCGETEGEALGHVLTTANYQDAPTCSVCGETEGRPLAGSFEEKRITCVSEENKSYEYVTSTGNLEEKTRGIVIMSGYRTFDSDDTHPALENYEWVTAQFELAFGDKNSWNYGNASVWAFSDYYTPELCEEGSENPEEVEGTNENLDMAVQYTVNYHGVDYDQCIACFTTPRQNDMKYAVYSMVFECYFRVPKGYDGMVVAFFDPALTMEENAGEELLTEYGDSIENAPVCIRLKKEDSTSGLPGMTVLSSIIPVQPGETIEASFVIRNDVQYKSGFYGLQKIAEFEDYDKSEVWNREPVYEVTTFTAETELVSQIEMPEEEGVYEVTAVVVDEDGNAVIPGLPCWWMEQNRRSMCQMTELL